MASQKNINVFVGCYIQYSFVGTVGTVFMEYNGIQKECISLYHMLHLHSYICWQTIISCIFSYSIFSCLLSQALLEDVCESTPIYVSFCTLYYGSW